MSKIERKFFCETCSGEFSPGYRIPKAKILNYCSKSCAAKSKRSRFYRATDLKKAIIKEISVAERYMTLEEVCKSVGVSSKTLTKFNISVLTCNREAGFKRPKRIFENAVFKILGEAFEVRREVCFDDCLSPKGYPLRYDFELVGKDVLVEADGNQHKHTDNPWYSEYAKKCDAIKDEYARCKGYTLVRVPYTKKVDVNHVLSALTAAYKATA